MSRKFYISTTLPYVNAAPHIGFGTEIIRADIFARYHKLLGEEVFFNTGTDEHGQKVYNKAIEAKMDPQAYADKWAEKFRLIIKPLGISPDVNFVRTTDPHHVAAAQKFWEICREAGDIYKKNYSMKYCVGCEMEKQDSELENGKCPEHPNMELETRKEENYFFRFSKYQDRLLKLYEDSPNLVIPDTRLKEIRSFVSSRLQDFSISRLKTKMPWGIEVPDDPGHVMYVWFDALVNYISVVGWPDDERRFSEWWIETGGVVQYCGKDNLRHQAAMWQAMLMSAGLTPSRHVIVDGFITSNGQKMSKSLGNVVDPLEVAKEYGTDALRYYVAREFSNFEDSDFTEERFKEIYNANLANGLGNLVSRVMKMSEQYFVEPFVKAESFLAVLEPAGSIPSVYEIYKEALDRFDLNRGANLVWREIKDIDKEIQSREPFKLFKREPEEAKKIVRTLVYRLVRLSVMLSPIMPETSEKIRQAILANKMPSALFVRK